MNYMFLPFRRYFDFQGRSRRLEFWLFFVLNFIIGAIFSIVLIAMFGAKLLDLIQRYGVRSSSFSSGGDLDSGYSWTLNIPPDVLVAELGPTFKILFSIYLIYTCIIFFPNLAVTIRRLHDSNRTGWWLMVPVLVYVLAALLAVLAVVTPAVGVVFGILAAILGLVAMVCGLVLLVFMFLDGTPGHNRHGPDPKARDYRPTFN